MSRGIAEGCRKNDGQEPPGVVIQRYVFFDNSEVEYPGGTYVPCGTGLYVPVGTILALIFLQRCRNTSFLVSP